MLSLTRAYPCKQEYLAKDAYVVLGASTFPFSGSSSEPQSIAVKQERNLAIRQQL